MEHLTGAYAAGRAAPTNDETQKPGRAFGFQEINQRSSAQIIPFSGKASNCDQPNVIARLTRAGHVVHECSEHGFTVVNPRWGMSRYCENFAALLAFARIVGVRHG